MATVTPLVLTVYEDIKEDCMFWIWHVVLLYALLLGTQVVVLYTLPKIVVEVARHLLQLWHKGREAFQTMRGNITEEVDAPSPGGEVETLGVLLTDVLGDVLGLQ